MSLDKWGYFEMKNLRPIRLNMVSIAALLGVVVFAALGCTTLVEQFKESMLPPTALPPPTRVTQNCVPTWSDEPSPTYKPDTPVRTVVGVGHVVTGVVLSSRDCQPITNAMLEFWPEEAGRGHPDSSRATFFTGSDGTYRFECNQPEHIHMRISAAGYQTIFSNLYHPEGQPEGVFNIVLRPNN